MFFIEKNSIQFIAAASICVVLIVLLIIGACISSVKNKKTKSNKVDNQLAKVEAKQEAKALPVKVEEFKEEPAKVEEKSEVKVEAKEESKEEPKLEEKPEETNDKPQDDVEVKALETKVKGKYEVFPENDSFKYVLKASNGQSLITSEGYKTVQGCKNAIKRLQESSKTAEIKIKEDKQGNFQFHVVNGTRIVAQSANYSTQLQATKASNSFMNFVLTENIVVLEEAVHEKPELVDLSDLDLTTDALGKILIVEDGVFTYKLVANNGQTICQSQSYKTLATIKNNIAKFKEAVYNGKFYMVRDKNKNYQFKLYTEQDRLIMTGETFQTAALCKSNIQSCYRFARDAEVELQETE